MVHQEQENQTTVQMQNPIDVQDDSEVTYQEQESQTTNTTDDKPKEQTRPRNNSFRCADAEPHRWMDQDDREVTFIGQASMTHPVLLEDTLAWEDSKPVLVIVVRRGHCLADLMMAFVDPEVMKNGIHVERKLPNGQLEEGEGSGVFRVCLTEF